MSTRLRANAWVKATASGLGNCVEIRLQGATVAIRDSKDIDGGNVVVPRGEFRNFIGDLKDGAFRPL